MCFCQKNIECIFIFLIFYPFFLKEFSQAAKKRNKKGETIDITDISSDLEKKPVIDADTSPSDFIPDTACDASPNSKKKKVHKMIYPLVSYLLNNE